MTQGSYLLLIGNPVEQRICIGKLGTLKFDQGFYVYVGSGMNGLDQRINRHLSKEKKMHWHIDYLLEKTSVIEVIKIISGSRQECSLAGKMKGIPIKSFGSSDCKCYSHLFYCKQMPDLSEFSTESYN